MAPMRDAVRFINCKQRDMQAGQRVAELGFAEAFGRDVDQLVFAGRQCLIAFVAFGTAQ